VGITFGDLLSDEDWIPLLSRDDESNPNYFWVDGRPLADAPVDYAATFDGSMWMSRKPIEVRNFNRNPLRVRPHFTVPRHHHNLDEMILVFRGSYDIDHGEGREAATVRVGPGDFFISRAGTPYTMTAGAEGVTYIETWPEPVPSLLTYWHDVGWVHR
jgi:mannose-6-phosphate isomerase-like protein (cupin superfamily)